MDKITIILDQSKNQKEYYECAEVVLEEKGMKKKRFVTIQSVLEAFSKSSVENPKSIRIGKVPRGYYDGTIWTEKEKLYAKVLIVLPKSQQMMLYENTRYDVPIPTLLFYITVIKSKLNETKVFALKEERVTEQEPLFVYPFGNVNTNGGNVCWGSNKWKDIDCLKDLDEVVTLFLQSECNSDHYTAGESCTLIDTPLRALFERLKKQDQFPDKWLMGCKDHYSFKTVGDLLKRFNN